MKYFHYPEKLVNEFKQAMIELNRLHGVELAQAKESSVYFSEFAFIGLISNYLSGFISLQASPELLRKTAPVKISSEVELSNWNKELLNSYSGILKTKLSKYSIKASISIPNQISVEDFRGFEKGVGPIEKLHFKSNFGNMTCQLTFNLSRFFKLELNDKHEEQNQPGTGLIF